MKWYIIGLVFIGIIAAIAATVLMVTLQANAGGGLIRTNPADEPVEILVATKSMPAMVVVAADNVAKQTVKRSEMPTNALTNTVQVVGQVLIGPVLEGQPFTSKQLASTDSGMHLAATLPEGFRAMSILLSDETGIEDVLYPGSLVDVVASFKLPRVDGSSSAEVVSATILQGIQVLAVGKRTIVSEQNDAERIVDDKRGRMITLMVNSQQAEMLNLASTNGKVSVSLRNPLDQVDAPLEGTRLSDLSKELADRIAALAAMESSRIPMTPKEVPAAESANVQLTRSTPGDKPDLIMGAWSAEPALTKAEPEPIYWTTTVLRGRLVEKQKFELPENPNPQ